MKLDPMSDLADFVAALRQIFVERKRGVLMSMVSCPIKAPHDLVALHATYNALHEAENAIGIALGIIHIDKEE